jgi:hypothetical protein
MALNQAGLSGPALTAAAMAAAADKFGGALDDLVSWAAAKLGVSVEAMHAHALYLLPDAPWGIRGEGGLPTEPLRRLRRLLAALRRLRGPALSLYNCASIAALEEAEARGGWRWHSAASPSRRAARATAC